MPFNRASLARTATLRNVQGAWIKEQQISVEGDRITSYKVNMMITFVLEDTMQGGQGGGE